MRLKLDRYKNLARAMDEIYHRGVRRVRVLEVGTYDGGNATAMAVYWRCLPGAKEFVYHGYDLFEDLTEEMSRAELSKRRLPPSMDEVGLRLASVGAVVSLTKGNTRETLTPESVAALPPPDLVFMDGGHSPETVRSDWEAIRHLLSLGDPIVLLDDFYVEGPAGFGCRSLVEGLPREYRVTPLDPVDTYEHTGLSIRMVRVSLDGAT